MITSLQTTEDYHSFRRPIEACSDDNVKSVQDILQKVRRVNIIHTADCLSLSCGTIHNITTAILGYKKVCTQWMPRMLTPRAYLGGAENAGVENAGVENVRADRRAGK